MDFPVAQPVKSPPAMQETWFQSLGWEDPLQKEMATHSTILDWKIPSAEQPALHEAAESQTLLSQPAIHDSI